MGISHNLVFLGGIAYDMLDSEMEFCQIESCLIEKTGLLFLTVSTLYNGMFGLTLDKQILEFTALVS